MIDAKNQKKVVSELGHFTLLTIKCRNEYNNRLEKKIYQDPDQVEDLLH